MLMPIEELSDANEKRVYLGKPENKRDPNAIAKPAHKQPNQNKPKRSIPPNKPSQRPLVANKDAVKSEPRTGDPLSDSIFGKGLSIKEVTPTIKFTPSAVALMSISRHVFQQINTDVDDLGKTMLPEYFDYYHVFCLWARFITLKQKLQYALTPEEEWFSEILYKREYTVPEPILIYLKGYGKYETSSGQHLLPEFPELPTSVIAASSGYYGAITADNHNLYEEIPCFGVLAEAVCNAIGDAGVGPYPSRLSTETATVNSNLLGYYPLRYRRQEAKNLALDLGITRTNFPESKQNTAINLGLINVVSDYLAGTRTFRNTSVCFHNLSELGMPQQAILTKPDETTIDVKSELIPQSLLKEKPSSYGSAIYCCYQLYKSTPRANWMCVTTGPQPQPDPYIPWDTNRNARRNLPVQFQQRVFVTVSQNAEAFRDNAITLLVLTKR